MKSVWADVLRKGFKEVSAMKDRQGFHGAKGSRQLEAGMSKGNRNRDIDCLESRV